MQGTKNRRGYGLKTVTSSGIILLCLFFPKGENSHKQPTDGPARSFWLSRSRFRPNAVRPGRDIPKYFPFGPDKAGRKVPVRIENYTRPENPMNAMARIPAVISAMGMPLNALGTSSKSRRSRIPAKSTSAKANPRAVATE